MSALGMGVAGAGAGGACQADRIVGATHFGPVAAAALRLGAYPADVCAGAGDRHPDLLAIVCAIWRLGDITTHAPGARAPADQLTSRPGIPPPSRALWLERACRLARDDPGGDARLLR